MRRAYSAAPPDFREKRAPRSGPATFAAVPLWAEIVITLLVGVATGVLSGMFGIGGAVVSTPAIRVLGATALQAIGSTLPSILPSSVSGSLRYRRERLMRPRVVAITSGFGAFASVVGSRLSGAVPGNGHALDDPDGRAGRVHGVPHRVPDGAHPRAGRDTAERRMVAPGDHRDRGRRAVGPARHRRRDPHGARVRGMGRDATEGDHRDLARVRRPASRSPARSRTGTSGTSTGRSRSHSPSA